MARNVWRVLSILPVVAMLAAAVLVRWIVEAVVYPLRRW
jgi:hypothetical protein